MQIFMLLVSVVMAICGKELAAICIALWLIADMLDDILKVLSKAAHD